MKIKTLTLNTVKTLVKRLYKLCIAVQLQLLTPIGLLGEQKILVLDS